MIVTAWNPLGQEASASQNAEAQARLSAQVRLHFPTSKEVMNGEGRWQEPALLVPGATLRDARRWGTEFDQAAVLFGVRARAALVWRGGRVERLWAARIQAPSPGTGSLEDGELQRP